MGDLDSVTRRGANGLMQGVDGTVLICRAPHPRGLGGESRYSGRICGTRLQVVPFRAVPTYRALRDWSEVRPGCLAVRCSSSDCRAFTEYAIDGPIRAVGGGLFESSPEVLPTSHS